MITPNVTNTLYAKGNHLYLYPLVSEVCQIMDLLDIPVITMANMQLVAEGLVQYGLVKIADAPAQQGDVPYLIKHLAPLIGLEIVQGSL